MAGLGLAHRELVVEGATLVRSLVGQSLLRAVDRVMRQRAGQVLAALGDRTIGIGSRDGYTELVQRSPGRFDVPLSEAELRPIWGSNGSVAKSVPWLGLVHSVLGPEARPSFCGVVFSRPGSPAQQASCRDDCRC